MKSRLRLILPAALASSLALTAVPAAGAEGPTSEGHPSALDRIDHIVVIYQENHSFDNLFGSWEGVNGLAGASAARTTQLSQARLPFDCLLQNDVNLTSPPLSKVCSGVNPTTGMPFDSHFKNQPFTIDTFIPSDARTCPPPGVFAAKGVPAGAGLPGGCTRDLVHRYYQEQYQLNGGQQNRYVTGSDAVGLAMGVYDTGALPIFQFLHQEDHPHYAIADNFFQGAFGGSFLNHQWLVAAATPTFVGARNDGSSNDFHSVVDLNGMPANSDLYRSPLDSAVKDLALTASCHPAPGRAPTPPGVVCGDNAVNTIQPFFQPFSPGTPVSRRLPPLTNPNIGDRLSAKGVDWAWYSGGWSNAAGNVGAPGWTNGTGPSCSDPNTDPRANALGAFPNCPDKLFQYHHQAFNYFANYAPGTTARAKHLGDEAEFLQLATSSTDHACNLKPVSFVKPIGAENEHPGYTGQSRGSKHLVSLIQAVESSACKKDTLVIATYDEFGGSWDHVPPPGLGSSGPHDKWGPGTRVPAVIIAPHLHGDFVVDHTQHDTTSILATIEHRFGIAPLGTRDAMVNDLSSVFRAREVGDEVGDDSGDVGDGTDNS